ncbi:MAG: sigma-54 dependent transcriptional regulator [Gammaproteobacteria bacterium]|nr:sigma-54 dependent transcriptional regulator [Gammaproteobacteria bacterium]
MTTAAPHSKILLVEDDTQIFNEIKSLMSFLGHETAYASTLDELKANLNQHDFTAILLGRFHDLSAQKQAVSVIDEYKDRYQVVLFNQPAENFEKYHSQNPSVIAHLDMPLTHQPVVDALARAKEFHDKTREEGSAACREMLDNIPKLVGQSAAMQYVRTMIEQVARTDASVLILGESGTGKEVVARNVHALSNRCKHSFVPVNCGAIPGDLLESELFGHEKGAFTGAISSRQGRFELAEEGTLFLDEIGDMSLPMQVKLLRVLQERTFERVGSNKSINADVRILAATHRNLEQQIGDGKFREDLFYRLNVFPIELPALRERLDDVPYLLQNQIEKLEREKRGSVRLTAAATEALCQYRWPGNVRELANLVERLTILFPGGVVDIKNLPPKYLPATVKGSKAAFNPSLMFGNCDEDDEDEEIIAAQPSVATAAATESPLPMVAVTESATELEITADGLNLKEHLAQMEIKLIKQALDNTDGVVAHAAKLLQMRRTTLVEKLKKYGINN